MSVQPIVNSEVVELLDVVACPGERHLNGTAYLFGPGTGFVPGLVTLYQKVRGTDVDKRVPLTRTEVLQNEHCKSCRHDAHKKNGTMMYPTANTLALMERWMAENVARAQEDENRRLRERNAKGSSLVVRTLAEGQKQKAPKKGRRYVGSPKPKRDPNAPKNYGTYSDHKSSTKNAEPQGKNKKGGKKQKDKK